MKALIITGASVAVVLAAFAVVPALKGPVNRARITTQEKLEAEYVIDNYKAEYLSMRDKKEKLEKHVQDFKIERRVTDKKLEAVQKELEIAKRSLIQAGTGDLERFASLRSIYDAKKAEVDALEAHARMYDNAVKKLEKTHSLLVINMSKAKSSIDTMSSKKVLLDTVKSVNKSIAEVNGTGSHELTVNIEKLDDDLMREDIKLNASGVDISEKTMTKEDAEAFLATLK